MKKLHAVVVKAAESVVGAVAVPWKKRAWVLDTLGGVCLVVGAAGFSERAAWLAASVWLTLRAVGIERRSDS